MEVPARAVFALAVNYDHLFNFIPVEDRFKGFFPRAANENLVRCFLSELLKLMKRARHSHSQARHSSANI